MATLKKNTNDEYYTTYNMCGAIKTVHFLKEIQSWLHTNHIGIGDELPDRWHQKTEHFHYTHGIQNPKISCGTEYTAKTRCPKCGSDVFYYENEYGSKVYFDELGWPWPKHPCFLYDNISLKNFVLSSRNTESTKLCKFIDKKDFSNKTYLRLCVDNFKIYLKTNPIGRKIIKKSDIYIQEQDSSIIFVNESIEHRKYIKITKEEFLEVNGTAIKPQKVKVETKVKVTANTDVKPIMTTEVMNEQDAAICHLDSLIFGGKKSLLHLKTSQNEYYICITHSKGDFFCETVLKKNKIYIDINKCKFLLVRNHSNTFFFKEITKKQFTLAEETLSKYPKDADREKESIIERILSLRNR